MCLASGGDFGDDPALRRDRLYRFTFPASRKKCWTVPERRCLELTRARRQLRCEAEVELREGLPRVLAGL
jgi:hypothetical protein